MIGGNCEGVLQTLTPSEPNAAGECTAQWQDAATIIGWLDLSSGDAGYAAFHARIAESTHIFLCDYMQLPGITGENARMIIDGQVYQVRHLDDPMGRHDQLEIYLKYIGGR